MPRTAPHPAAPWHPVVAVACALVSLGLLASLHVVAPADAALDPPGGPGWWLTIATLLVQATAVAGVGRFPATAPPVLTAVPLVLAWVAPTGVFSLTAVAEAAAVYLAVVARPSRRPWATLAVTALLLSVAHLVNDVRGGDPQTVMAVVGALLQALVVVGLPLLFGLLVAARRDADRARHQEVRALRREQDALLAAAVSQQRVAMSRELHDIAAHHVSGIALLAAAADRQIDSDPAAAKRSARQIREQSSAVLDDLRRLVGLLREGADATRPPETLDAVAALVDTRRAAGAEIDLVTHPAPVPLRPLAQLVAYRMVQESLANAAAHAPGARCAVEIGEPHDGLLTIAVRNRAPVAPGRAGGGGFGLVGMAERAQLVGAELVHGPTPDGGWEVRLTLPAADDPAGRMLAPIPEAPA